jgi:hypothetical protein
VYDESGGGIAGAVSMIDGARECEEITVGWYDLWEVYGLFLFSKFDFFCMSDSSFESGDLTGVLRDLLREGPSGILGNNCEMPFPRDFSCSLQVEKDVSSLLKDAKRSGVFCKSAATGRRTRFLVTYGRLSGSSTDVNKRTCEALLD